MKKNLFKLKRIIYENKKKKKIYLYIMIKNV